MTLYKTHNLHFDYPEHNSYTCFTSMPDSCLRETLYVYHKRQSHFVTAAMLNPDSRVSSQCTEAYFFARLCVSNGIRPRLCQWREPLRSVQLCRCTPCLCGARITIRVLHAFEVVQYECRSSVVGSRAVEFELTRLLATCVASRLVPASVVFLIRDRIAGLCCASGEKQDSTISLCLTILSEYTRTLGHSLTLLTSTLRVIEALILYPLVNLYNILQINTRVVKKEHDMDKVHTRWVTRARLQLWLRSSVTTRG